jgi:ADP-heptose:LPS heptosyltransferase
MLKLTDLKTDCRFFRGDIPCKQNKEFGVTCDNCSFYKKTDSKVLIIKLGAAGDVIRTTPLLYPLKNEYPGSKIFWLTYTPELVPVNTEYNADVVLKCNFQNAMYLKEIEFDVVINLDKDKEAIALMKNLKAKKKFGYTIKDDTCYPVNRLAEHKYLTGVFDNLSKENKKSYLEEIFEICGYKFKKEKYILELDEKFDMKWDIDTSKKVIGLNTGCGERWTSRLWSDDNWMNLVHRLIDKGYEVILLGGQQEHSKNKLYSENTKAKYFGHFPLETFLNLVNKCELVITQVTMTMHIAIGLNKKLVLMNNIFNPNEYELYGNGEIIQPRKECKCYFSPKCVNPEYNCMDFLLPEDILNSTVKLLG